jgi:dTDP-4-amino-4,6-dideoxygalactose transaminase
LKQKLQAAKRENCLPKALVMVHFAGLSEHIEELSEVLKSYNVALIEDAAHGLGGHDNGAKIGSCRFSDIAVLSFHPVKSITTAEGGAVMTNDSALAEKIVLYAKHGITREKSKLTEQHGPWYYQQQLLGFNYRLSDLHAALGITQMRRLDTFVAARRKLAHRYHQLLVDLPLRLPKQMAVNTDGSAWHLYMVEVLEHDRATVFEGLRAAGIGVNVHYIPIHLQPYYQALGFTAGQFPNAERFYQRAITLPLYPTLCESEQDIVVDALKELLS